MKILKFYQFIKESGIGGVNVGGVNFGTDRGDVGTSNFGKKGDYNFNKRGSMNPIDSNLIYSDYKNDYYSQSDIRALLFKYDVWCKQHNETPIEINNFDSKTLDYILRTIDSVS